MMCNFMDVSSLFVFSAFFVEWTCFAMYLQWWTISSSSLFEGPQDASKLSDHCTIHLHVLCCSTFLPRPLSWSLSPRCMFHHCHRHQESPMERPVDCRCSGVARAVGEIPSIDSTNSNERATYRKKGGDIDIRQLLSHFVPTLCHSNQQNSKINRKREQRHRHHYRARTSRIYIGILIAFLLNCIVWSLTL